MVESVRIRFDIITCRPSSACWRQLVADRRASNRVWNDWPPMSQHGLSSFPGVSAENTAYSSDSPGNLWYSRATTCPPARPTSVRGLFFLPASSRRPAAQAPTRVRYSANACTTCTGGMH